MLKFSDLKNEVRNRPNLKKIIQNTSWIFTDNAIRICVNFFVSIWVARYLGPIYFGALSYALALTSMFNVVAYLGINDLVVRELVHFRHLQNKIMGSAFLLKIIGSVLSVAISTSLAFWTRSSQPQVVLMVFLISISFTFQALDVIDFQYHSKILSKYSIWMRNIGFLVFSTLKVIFILMNLPVVYFALASSIEILVGSIAVVIIYIAQKNSPFGWRVDKKIFKKLFLGGLPILVSGTLALIYLKIDRILVGRIIGDVALGNYSAATALCDPWVFVPSAIATSVFSTIIDTRKANHKLYLDRMRMILSFLMQIAFVVALLETLFAPFLISHLFGSSYSAAAPVLAVYIWTILFVFVDAGAVKWFLVEDLQRFLAYRALIGAVIAFMLNYLLIKRYGIVGGATAAVLTQFIIIYLFNLLFFKTRALFKMQTKAFVDVITLQNFRYFFKSK